MRIFHALLIEELICDTQNRETRCLYSVSNKGEQWTCQYQTEKTGDLAKKSLSNELPCRYSPTVL